MRPLDSSRFTSGLPITRRPDGMGKFQFVVLASLRAAQLQRGCTARVDGGHKATVTAQFEVAEGKVTQTLTPSTDVRPTKRVGAAASGEPVIVRVA